ncbi:MAG TPA: hypothetical protein VFT82_04415 [Candidatus Paceibacterota bacterium]|nr:hypothetical protein [Candidatus Paceibacterota bacterium]
MKNLITGKDVMAALLIVLPFVVAMLGSSPTHPTLSSVIAGVSGVWLTVDICIVTWMYIWSDAAPVRVR